MGAHLCDRNVCLLQLSRSMGPRVREDEVGEP